MKNHFSVLTKLVAVAACALTLGSCNRAEYAMLPQGASYHGVTRAATPVPAKPEAAVAAKTVETTPATAVAEEAVPATSAPAAAQAAIASKKTPAATKPVATKAPEAAAVEAPAAVATTPAAAPVKLNLVQRLALTKISKKLEKANQNLKLNRHDNTAATQRLNGKLRQGLILLIVGLLVGIIGGAVGGSIGSVIGLLGLILAIIGIILIIIYLLDEL